MTPTERRQLCGFMLVFFPVAAWFITVKQTEYLPPDHKIRVLFQLAAETPHRPFLILALAGGLILSILVVWAFAVASRSEFSGAPSKGFYAERGLSRTRS